MNDRDALLKAILTEPEDDTVRLVFADWLDEHDEPERAEFIRVQVAIALIQGDPGMPHPLDNMAGLERKRLLMRRETELCSMQVYRGGAPNRKRHTLGRAYFAECGAPLSGLRLERGFLRLVTVTPAAFVAHGGRIFASHPVASVRLFGREPDLVSLEEGDRRRVWYREIVDVEGVSDLGYGTGIIPAALFDLLPGDKAGGVWIAPNEAAAVAALSHVAVAYGRQLAGLPPLPDPATFA